MSLRDMSEKATGAIYEGFSNSRGFRLHGVANTGDFPDVLEKLAGAMVQCQVLSGSGVCLTS